MSGLYAKISTQLPNDPRIIEAGPTAELVYIRCLLGAREGLTDGLIHARLAPRYCHGIHHRARAIGRLEDVGLLIKVEEGWQIPRKVWDEWNPTKADVQGKREEERLRKAAYRKRLSTGGPDNVPTGHKNTREQPEPEPEPEQSQSQSNIKDPLTGSTGGVDKSLEEAALTAAIDHAMTQATNIGNPKNYRTTVERNTRRDHGNEIRRLAIKFPTAPATAIAHGATTGDTRRLNHYAEQPDPEPTPDEPKLTPEQIQATINAAKGAA